MPETNRYVAKINTAIENITLTVFDIFRLGDKFDVFFNSLLLKFVISKPHPIQ